MTTAPLSLYHIIKPSKKTKGDIPVLFMLHGYGSNEDDLFSFAPEFPEELCIISVRAPYPMPNIGNAWYAINFDADRGKWNDVDEALSSRDKIATFIKEACETYRLDEKNVTLLGFSQGTILSYAVALSFPKMVKNVIALSGYISLDMVAEEYKNNDLTKLNIYASHGSADQVIPISWARKNPEILTQLGVKHTYEEFPIGHGVSPQNFYSFKEWLSNKI